MAPWIFGCRVLTRPPSISLTPVTSCTARTAIPSLVRRSAVPPVERISIPSEARPLASSTMPALSETERRARDTDMRALLPWGLAARTRTRAAPRPLLLRGAVARGGAAAARLLLLGRAAGRVRAARGVVLRAHRADRFGRTRRLVALALRGACAGDALLLVLADLVDAAVALRGRGRAAVGSRAGIADLGRRVRALRGVRALRRDRRIGALHGRRAVRALRSGRVAGGGRRRLRVFLGTLCVARRLVLRRIAQVDLRERGGGAERQRRENRNLHGSSWLQICPAGDGPGGHEPMQRPGPGPARPAAVLEAEGNQLADEIGVERDGVESARPSDLRPVVRFHFADHGAPALRGGGNESVVPARLLREIGVRRPQERVGRQQIAVRRDAAVGDPLHVGDLAIEPLERRYGEIRERAHRRGGDSFQRQIGDRRAEMRRSDGDERSDAPSQAQARNRIARIEPAHAVGDEVDALAGKAPYRVG